LNHKAVWFSSMRISEFRCSCSCFAHVDTAVAQSVGSVYWTIINEFLKKNDFMFSLLRDSIRQDIERKPTNFRFIQHIPKWWESSSSSSSSYRVLTPVPDMAAAEDGLSPLPEDGGLPLPLPIPLPNAWRTRCTTHAVGRAPFVVRESSQTTHWTSVSRVRLAQCRKVMCATPAPVRWFRIHRDPAVSASSTTGCTGISTSSASYASYCSSHTCYCRTIRLIPVPHTSFKTRATRRVAHATTNKHQPLRVCVCVCVFFFFFFLFVGMLFHISLPPKKTKDELYTSTRFADISQSTNRCVWGGRTIRIKKRNIIIPIEHILWKPHSVTVWYVASLFW